MILGILSLCRSWKMTGYSNSLSLCCYLVPPAQLIGFCSNGFLKQFLLGLRWFSWCGCFCFLFCNWFFQSVSLQKWFFDQIYGRATPGLVIGAIFFIMLVFFLSILFVQKFEIYNKEAFSNTQCHVRTSMDPCHHLHMSLWHILLTWSPLQNSGKQRGVGNYHI